MNYSHAKNAKFSYIAEFCLTQISRISRSTHRCTRVCHPARTLDKVDKLRALIAMQPFREIREIRVRPKHPREIIYGNNIAVYPDVSVILSVAKDPAQGLYVTI